MSDKSTVTVEIDGREFEAAPGSMVIEVTDQAGIYIPRFCYHEKLSVAANCRMCLVEVERAPKPLPACATPVMDGMKVKTRSAVAVGAQKDTLEFLLINHPLDCPICDQGGECPLQDQAVGYGGHLSRFEEKKRAVPDHDIGPLIETEMTRCIHCTRCVRFGDEVAGIMEFGITGRGEHLKIDTFFGSTVDSEVSGNVIDLCPVGALTSKPYRFSARSWELIDHASISPHDCVGTNISIQTLRGVVKRVLPRTNEAVNECWLADRDRYSYEATEGQHRLTEPMVRGESGLVPVSWQQALDAAVSGLRGVIEQEDPSALGALVSPTATFEEFYLVQKLMRALGSDNVDHRLRQIDFTGDDDAPLYPGTDLPIERFSDCRRIVLIGSNIRKEQPLLGLRIRKAWQAGAQVAAINSMDWTFNFGFEAKTVVAPGLIPYALAQVLLALCEIKGLEIPESLAKDFLKGTDEFSGNEDCRKTAQILSDQSGDALIVLGQSAISHPMYSCIERLTQYIAQAAGAKVAVLPPANSAAGWLAGCVPHRDVNGQESSTAGYNARQMIHNPRSGYLLFNIEPSKDMADGMHATGALDSAQFVVSLQSFSQVPDYVDVVLPIAPFTENAGTFVNCEGRVQHAIAAVEPLGEARPGWKILRVLGNRFGVPGFDYVEISDVLNEASLQVDKPDNQDDSEDRPVPCVKRETLREPGYFELISDPQIYAVDPTVRRAHALQLTADATPLSIGMHPDDMALLDLASGTAVTLRHDLHSVNTLAVADARVARGCVYFSAGSEIGPAAALGAEVRIEREAQAVE